MKRGKRIIALSLAVLLVAALFAGCSSTEEEEVTEDDLLIAYTAECEPFLYRDENGEWAGFDIDILNAVFDDIQGEYSDYKFVEVPEGFVLGEDTYYTDSNGIEYSPIIYIGGFTKNEGTVNEDMAWSENILENDVITLVKAGSSIESYSDVAGKKAAVVSGSAADALAENRAVEESLKSVKEYASVEEALQALDAGSVDILIVDEMSLANYYANGSIYDETNYTALPGELGETVYAYAFAKSENLSYDFNESVARMLDENYDDGDSLTPLVEQYFYAPELCVFDYES